MTTLLTSLGRPLLALLLAAAALAAAEPDPNDRFGPPGPAKADPRDREAYLIERPQYVLSYNAETRRANWVCWRLRKKDIDKAASGSR
jgi:endonuclease G